MTQIESAKKGIVTEQMKICAKKEGVDTEKIINSLISGTAVIPCNKNHYSLISPSIVGKGYLVKVNSNIGTSMGYVNLNDELDKLKVSIESLADSVMDLSTWGDLKSIRKEIIKQSTVPIGSVPVYGAAVKAVEENKNVVDFSEEDFIDMVQEHAEDGIDFMTIHAGLTSRVLDVVKNSKRVIKIVSRGGSIIAGWMFKNNKENPFYAHFDKILEIAKKYDITLSLGDSLRPGTILDSTDAPQISELIALGELVQRARNANVQVMVEGPGHIFLDQIEANMVMQKSICKEAPFFVLGPIVTDIAPGYDHITSAIGGALAGMYGADFLCYVTPAEHLRLPDIDDVREGTIVTRIAAHAADLSRRNPVALAKDREMGIARKNFNWEKQFEISIDPEKAKNSYSKKKIDTEKGCSMCGPFCAIKITEEFLEGKKQ
jgi:phosphomethylpyrimidine synthase